MITRRDVVVAAVVACATMAAVAWAESGGKPILGSSVFDWESIKVERTSVGAKRPIFIERTATLEKLDCHATTVNPGLAPHAPHQHPEEELIIIKEGTLEAMQNGKTTRVGPGSVIFEASNDFHGLKNVGETPATYFVVKWWPPGMATDAAK